LLPSDVFGSALPTAPSASLLPLPANMSLPANLKTVVPLPKIYKPEPRTAEAPGFKQVDGETIPRRNAKCKDALKVRPHDTIHTAHDILKYASSKFGNANAVGSRKLIKTHHEVKKIKKVVDGKETTVEKTWQYAELGPYSYQSYIEFERLCLQIGAGLRKLGLVAGDKLHLFAQTHPHWLASAHGTLLLA
jgi:long-chain acyl-CoA synthetase